MVAMVAVQPLIPRTASPRRRWLLAWAGLAVLGVANGILRETTYQPFVGEQAGHQISTVTLVVLIAGFVWLLQRRWPLRSTEEALRIGATWTVLTVGFEFGFGHYVDGRPWATLLAEYDVTSGHLWPLVLVTIAVAPVLARRLGR
jgi:hypothetical protein